MNHALIVSIVGLFGGFLLFLPFHLMGRFISSGYWAVGQLFALTFFGSLLTLTSIYGSSVFTLAVLVTLTTFATIQMKRLPSAFQFFSQGCGKVFGKSGGKASEKLLRGIFIVSIVLLGIDLLWTSFPFYRFDQWNYHLSVSKIIANSWLPLPDWVFEDHIYFTGFYEYLFLLPRVFTNNDLYNQSISNVFSWLMYVSLSYGALKILLIEKHGKKRLFMIVSTAVILFCTPHREALSNAKPEALLIPLTMIGIGMIHQIWMQAMTSHSSQASAHEDRLFVLLCLAFGYAMTAPLALKITWLHPAAALGISFGLCLLFESRMPKLRAIVYTSLGVGLGFVLSCVPFLKNQHFFGNPLHPFQGLFHSSRWSEFMAFHWERDNKPAHSFAEYLNIFRVLPEVWLSRLGWPIAAVLPVLFRMQYLKTRRDPSLNAANGSDSGRQNINRLALLCAAAFCLFTLIWPFVGNPIIQPRYALSGLGIVFAIIIVFLGRKASLESLQGSVYLGLLVPLLAQSKADTSLKNVIKLAGAESVEAYYKNKGTPYDILELSHIVNRDRKQRYFNANPYEHIALTDTPMGYFLDSIRLRAPYYDYEYLRQAFYQASGKQCLSAFLLSLNVNYFIHYEKDFYPLPDDVLKLIEHATPLTQNMENQPKAYHIETAVLRQIKTGDPNCR